jgi:hypothetical protein
MASSSLVKVHPNGISEAEAQIAIEIERKSKNFIKHVQEKMVTFRGIEIVLGTVMAKGVSDGIIVGASKAATQVLREVFLNFSWEEIKDILGYLRMVKKSEVKNFINHVKKFFTDSATNSSMSEVNSTVTKPEKPKGGKPNVEDLSLAKKEKMIKLEEGEQGEKGYTRVINDKKKKRELKKCREELEIDPPSSLPDIKEDGHTCWSDAMSEAEEDEKKEQEDVTIPKSEDAPIIQNLSLDTAIEAISKMDNLMHADMNQLLKMSNKDS